ncbi:hypothetical protein BH20VER2_BH20VER2_17990 [soil metagenome]
MRFITAVAREDKEAKRLAYSSVGNVEQARQAGESPATIVSARGRDEKFLQTLSLKRVGSD